VCSSALSIQLSYGRSRVTISIIKDSLARTYVLSVAAARFSQMETVLKGTTTEAAVLSALVARNISVLLPFGGGGPYDLGADLGDGHFLRIQCKTARPVKGGCLSFNGRRTDHGHGRRSYVGLADVFGVHDPQTGSVYLVPVSEASYYAITLRLEPTKNNQRLGIRFAADYEIDRWSIESLRQLVSTSEITAEVATA